MTHEQIGVVGLGLLGRVIAACFHRQVIEAGKMQDREFPM